MKDLVSLFRFSLAGLRVLIVATVICGLAYPLAVTAAAQVAMPWRADGSLVTATGAHTTHVGDAVGSALIGQVNTSDALFYPRPSAAGSGYDMTSTAGTNLGPNDPRLIAAIAKARAVIAKREGVSVGQVPPDAATSSASGLDPNISPAYAALQIPRVAKANGLSVAEVTALVAKYTAGRTWGVLGEPRVNVLLLNIAVRHAAGH